MRATKAGSLADGRAMVCGSVPGSTVVLVVAGAVVVGAVVAGAAVDAADVGVTARAAVDEQPASSTATATTNGFTAGGYRRSDAPERS